MAADEVHLGPGRGQPLGRGHDPALRRADVGHGAVAPAGAEHGGDLARQLRDGGGDDRELGSGEGVCDRRGRPVDRASLDGARERAGVGVVGGDLGAGRTLRGQTDGGPDQARSDEREAHSDPRVSRSCGPSATRGPGSRPRTGRTPRRGSAAGRRRAPPRVAGAPRR